MLQGIEITVTAGCAGLVLGLGYFAALKRTIAIFCTGQGWRTVLLLSLMRISVAVTAFILLARLGATALICAAIGFLIARQVALQWAREPQ